MNVERITATLADVTKHQWRDSRVANRIKAAIEKHKRDAVTRDDQSTAKWLWCLETILYIQQEYLRTFEELQGGHYHKAWCTLEKVEIACGFLDRHFHSEDDRYKTDFIVRHTERYQTLYPYHLFYSPALLKKKVKCSICGSILSIRNPCGHMKGEIYNGELCSREVVEFDVLEVSLVTNPVQKYSVLFTKGNNGGPVDHYDYTLVRYVVKGLRTPFDPWDISWTRIRHPHSLYSHVASSDPCPCGSGKCYADCCLQEEGVLRPHARVHFSIPPPEDLPPFIYSRTR